MLDIVASRREVCKGAGALIVSFSIGGETRNALGQDAAMSKPVALNEVDSFLAIDPQGIVTVYSGKVDLRQRRAHAGHLFPP